MSESWSTSYEIHLLSELRQDALLESTFVFVSQGQNDEIGMTKAGYILNWLTSQAKTLINAF